ncbi:hypothetical protein MASR2M78_36190 [Treponema sp.]
MCPDRQLLSVYIDGELPSPWGEKLENHLEDCPSCRTALSNFKEISEGLRSPNLAMMEESKARVWKELSKDLHNSNRQSLPQVWRKRLVVPLPAAVAAVLIVALLAAYVGGPILNKTPADNSIARFGTEMQGVIPVSDMSGVLQYLESQDATADIVIIRLPESKNFTASGEPSLIRAADYTKRRAP